MGGGGGGHYQNIHRISSPEKYGGHLPFVGPSRVDSSVLKVFDKYRHWLVFGLVLTFLPVRARGFRWLRQKGMPTETPALSFH